MNDSEQDECEVSTKLDVTESGNDKIWFGRTCLASPIIKCKPCGEVFYAGYYENHLCFQKEIDKVREIEMRNPNMSVERNKTNGALLGNEYLGNTPSISETILFLNYRNLEAILDIRPVINKLWRASSVLKLFSKTEVKNGYARGKFNGIYSLHNNKRFR
eukprot:GHVR01112600.1.p1 GENE.GHVR01112600.1~~GHVR01112600.1.p1  ORF type:complete len:160 (+),score=11.55 GHVR01112600.1:263-742(+)